MKLSEVPNGFLFRTEEDVFVKIDAYASYGARGYFSFLPDRDVESIGAMADVVKLNESLMDSDTRVDLEILAAGQPCDICDTIPCECLDLLRNDFQL